MNAVARASGFGLVALFVLHVAGSLLNAIAEPLAIFLVVVFLLSLLASVVL